jgi:hypothetical protein
MKPPNYEAIAGDRQRTGSIITCVAELATQSSIAMEAITIKRIHSVEAMARKRKSWATHPV